MDAFTPQPRAMPGKRRKAVCVDDPVERYVLLAVPERVANGSRCAESFSAAWVKRSTGGLRTYRGFG